MKKNSLIILLLIISLFAFNARANALTKDEMCADASYACFCLKSDSSKCTLQKTAPSGHNYAMDNKDKCGCNAGSPQNYTPYSQTSQASAKSMDLCQNAGVVKSAQIVGWMLLILRIVAPILLIIFAMIDLGKAVISSDDKAINQAVTTLIKRALAAAIIFFIPTIIALVFNLVGNAGEAKNKYKCLSTCLNKPGSCSIPTNKLFK